MNKRKAVLADYVRSTRSIHELTQRDLAKELGVSHTYISKIETQHIEIMPSVKFIQKLADVRGVSYDSAMKAVGMIDSRRLEAYLDKHPSAASAFSDLIDAKESVIQKLVTLAFLVDSEAN